MKKLASLLIAASLLVIGFPSCAAPIPPRATTIILSWDAAPAPGLATVIYYSMPADATWQARTNAPGVTSCSFTNPPLGLVFAATFFEVSTGNESEWTDTVTNTILFPGPSTMSISKR
jgi:hypothetical protein